MASQTQTVEHAHGHEHEHGVLHHHFDDMAQQRESTFLGMWLFLATEAMMFGGLFFAYSLYRWKFSVAFHEGAHHQNITLGTLNTFVLLFSSLTMARAVHAAVERNKKQLVQFLIWTMVLGTAFIVVKYFEWGHDYHEGLMPAIAWNFYDRAENQHLVQELVEKGSNPHQVMMYFVIYFSMTGLHAIHMIVGLGCLAVFLRLAMKGQFTNGNDQPVEIMGLYWHFVDIVWVFLFPLLYLIAGFHPSWLPPPPGGH
jgi:cytochrome c oxidase subunit 3